MGVLILSPNGIHTTKATLAAAALAADVAGKTVVVTSPQTITTAITWPADRAIEFKKGGYLTLSGGGSFILAANVHNPVTRPEWFGGATYVQLNNAILALPSTGGIVDATGYQGAQTITGQVLVPSGKNNVTIKFGAATFTLSGLTPTQGQSGTIAQFLTEANDTQFLGEQTKMKFAGTTLTPMVFASYYNALRMRVEGFDLDGGKSTIINVNGNQDDTFGSAINVFNATNGAIPATELARSIVKHNKIHDFYHYGITAYGDLSGGGEWSDNVTYNNGKIETGTQRSTGIGIYVNKGTSEQIVARNRSYGNARSGINITTAGAAHKNNKLLYNYTYNNGWDGIKIEESSELGALSGIGQDNLIVQGNHSYSNAHSGISITQTEVTGTKHGYIHNVLVEGNFSYSNILYGISLASTDSATNNVQGVKITNNIVLNNTSYGIGVGSNVLDTVVMLNTSLGNGGGEYLDSGTRTIEAWNKFANSTALSTASTIYAAGVNVAGGLVSFSEQGVRSWTIQALGGNLKIESGDGMGSLMVNGSVK